jgi:hypothetical protein
MLNTIGRRLVHYLKNPMTAATHIIWGTQQAVCQVERPSGMIYEFLSFSEARQFAQAGDVIRLLRDLNESILLKDRVNIEANGFSMSINAVQSLISDGGQTVTCEVNGFEKLENLVPGGTPEQIGLIQITGTNSNVTIHGKLLRTSPIPIPTVQDWKNWNALAAINMGTDAVLRLRIKRIEANAIEVGGIRARTIVEDGVYISPMGASFAYRVAVSPGNIIEYGRIEFHRMTIVTGNCLTFDAGVKVSYNNCRIICNGGGFIGRVACFYTLINCQMIVRGSAYFALNGAMNRFYLAGQTLELIGTNVFFSTLAAHDSWITYNAAGTTIIAGKVITNKPSPGTNFSPLVGTAANGSIVVDPALTLDYLQQTP